MALSLARYVLELRGEAGEKMCAGAHR